MIKILRQRLQQERATEHIRNFKGLFSHHLNFNFWEFRKQLKADESLHTVT